VRVYGQGGALLERGTAETPLTNGLGIGYTFNCGNRTAVLIVGGFLVLSLSLVALGVFAALTGG